MPRARGHNSQRGTRANTYISGVTFQTSPSGVTLSKGSGIQGDVMTNSAGAGYTIPHLTTGLLMKTGGFNNNTSSGTTKADAAYFGLSAIKFCIANIACTNVMNGGTTGLTVTVTASKPIPAAGVSRVYFRVRDAAGSACKKPVSVQYFAVGS